MFSIFNLPICNIIFDLPVVRVRERAGGEEEECKEVLHENGEGESRRSVGEDNGATAARIAPDAANTANAVAIVAVIIVGRGEGTVERSRFGHYDLNR